MRLRSAHLLALSVALPPVTATLPAAAAENDDVLKVVDEICANPGDKLNDTGAKASKLGFGVEHGSKAGPPPVHGAWLPKLGGGSVLTFSAKSESEPVNECSLVSHVQDLADLVARLKAKFDLGEPRASDAGVQLTMSGRKAIRGETYSVELVYGFEQNKPSGAFTFKTYR